MFVCCFQPRTKLLIGFTWKKELLTLFSDLLYSLRAMSRLKCKTLTFIHSDVASLMCCLLGYLCNSSAMSVWHWDSGHVKVVADRNYMYIFVNCINNYKAHFRRGSRKPACLFLKPKAQLWVSDGDHHFWVVKAFLWLTLTTQLGLHSQCSKYQFGKVLNRLHLCFFFPLLLKKCI